jgi:hypothetical protein
MLSELPASNIEQHVTSTFQETVFASSSCCETVVTPNSLADMSQSTATSHRSDILNPARNSGTPYQNSSRHCISLVEKEPASEQIQHNMKHTLPNNESIFEQGCDIHHKVSSDPVTSKIHRNFRNVSAFSDASLHCGIESLNKEVPCEVTNTADLAADSSTDTSELAVLCDCNQHMTSLKCIKESAFHTATGNRTTQYSFNKDTEKTRIPASSDTDNILSCPGSLAHSTELWNFGCNHKKSDVICDTVDAWSSSRSGKLFLNLKQSLFGHTNRTERIMLIGGSKPLVFGGTYPIDVPLERNIEETVNKSDKHVSPQTFDIDAPCLGFVEQTLSSALVDSQNTVLRRKKTVCQKCTAVSSSPE